MKSTDPGQLSTAAPATIAPIPMATRRSKFSLNTNQARRVVKTASALSSSDAPDAGIDASPNMSSTGPMIPPKKIAPPSGRRSERASRTRADRRISR